MSCSKLNPYPLKGFLPKLPYILFPPSFHQPWPVPEEKAPCNMILQQVRLTERMGSSGWCVVLLLLHMWHFAWSQKNLSSVLDQSIFSFCCLADLSGLWQIAKRMFNSFVSKVAFLLLIFKKLPRLLAITEGDSCCHVNNYHLCAVKQVVVVLLFTDCLT